MTTKELPIFDILPFTKLPPIPSKGDKNKGMRIDISVSAYCVVFSLYINPNKVNDYLRDMRAFDNLGFAIEYCGQEGKSVYECIYLSKKGVKVIRLADYCEKNWQ